MDTMTIQMAVRYFDIVLYKTHLMEENLITTRHTKKEELENSRLSYAIFQNADALFMTADSKERIQSIKNSKLQLVAITCLLIACKFYEKDENLVRIFELEKAVRYKYTYKNFTR